MKSSSLGLATQCARAGSVPRHSGANEPVQPSIVQSAIFDLGGAEEAEAIFSGARKGYAYSRFGNPTVDVLARTLADLEGGAEALVVSSGNAAVLCAITTALHERTGPLVTHPDIYGGSFELLRILGSVYRLPVETVDPADEKAWLSAVERAGAVLVETPSNPLMRLIDLAATIERARSAGAPVIVDNTVATPLNQRPFEFGADWVIHSTTKYLNGHGDLIGGCVIRREPLTKAHRAIHKNLGGTVNAFEAWLVLRGLRTLALRMEAHNRNAEAIAAWLATRPEVKAVYYPGFPSHPQSALFQRQMKRGSGLLSFELAGGETAAMRFINRLKLIVHAVSLGGPETLVTLPAKSSHRGMTAAARAQAGVGDGLIRLSAGLESTDDLVADLAQALG
ncbi:MAG TPA: aminotransferase class I/II-fold pyridoxal phosphate-dependent enzyme [Opitutaceae bacterium]|nr:aminotransferase class I/II-fold pyridoxal phosphate-dependent enzyme [Opitutaceae bacterium]